MIAAAVNQIARFMVDWMKERFFQKPDDPKVTRIVRYESGTGEVIEIIEVPDPHKAAEYKVPTNDELRPKPSRRFKGKTAIRASGRRNAFIHPSAWRNCLVNSLRRLNCESLEGQWDINGAFRSLAPPAELLFGPSPEFPNSFGNRILGSSR
jgi:hypothetical protein